MVHRRYEEPRSKMRANMRYGKKHHFGTRPTLMPRERGTLRSLTKYQGTNGANSHTLGAVLAMRLAQWLIPKGGDHSSKARVSKANGSLAQFLLARPNAFAAEHAFVGVIDEQGTAGVYG